MQFNRTRLDAKFSTVYDITVHRHQDPKRFDALIRNMVSLLGYSDLERVIGYLQDTYQMELFEVLGDELTRSE